MINWGLGESLPTDCKNCQPASHLWPEVLMFQKRREKLSFSIWKEEGRKDGRKEANEQARKGRRRQEGREREKGRRRGKEGGSEQMKERKGKRERLRRNTFNAGNRRKFRTI